MSTVVYNPTDKLGEEFQEEFRGHYMGVGIGITPGQKIKLPDAKARHLLNEFAPRGLVALDYGDDEEKRANEGLERNRNFKLKQLNDFNEKNEARKHMGLPYLWPTETLKRYAKEIGVKLTESYKVDDAQLQRAKALEEENKNLRSQMAEMNEKFEKLMSMVSEKFTQEEEAKARGPGRPKKE